MVQHDTLANHIWFQDVILHVYIQQAHVHFCLCLLIQLRVLFVVCVHVCCADLYIIRKICFIQLILQMLQITNTNKLHNLIHFYNKKHSLSFDSQVEHFPKYSEFSFITLVKIRKGPQSSFYKTTSELSVIDNSIGKPNIQIIFFSQIISRGKVGKWDLPKTTLTHLSKSFYLTPVKTDFRVPKTLQRLNFKETQDYIVFQLVRHQFISDFRHRLLERSIL